MNKGTKDATGMLAAIMNPAIDKVNKMDVDEEPLSPFPKPEEKAEFSPVETAIAVALAAHKGQKDKAGAPYILHPLRLMFQMETEQEMIGAVLPLSLIERHIVQDELFGLLHGRKGFIRFHVVPPQIKTD